MKKEKWTCYQKLVLWFSYEQGASYDILCRQLLAKKSKVNYHLCEDRIRSAGYQKRLHMKRLQCVKNLSQLRLRMQSSKIPLKKPVKPFSALRIQEIMARPAPWLVRGGQKTLFETSKVMVPLTFDVFCQEMHAYGFLVRVVRQLEKPHAFYSLYHEGRFINVFMKTGVVRYINKWRQSQSLPPCEIDGVTFN